MVKSGEFNHFPSQGSNISKRSKNISKPLSGLSKSTKIMLIITLVVVSVILIWIVLRAVIKVNPNETPVDKFTADLQISGVRIINYTDLSLNVNGDTSNQEFNSVNIVLYDDNNSEIARRQISIQQLEASDFQVNLQIPNTSKIKDIAVTPSFTSLAGEKVLGQVEATYTVSEEEKYNAQPIQEETPEVKPSCTVDTDCNDNNACTDNVCSNGNCSYPIVEGCVPCTSASQCEDSNNCTTNTCSDGKCVYLQIPGCTQCGSNLNCDDNNACTNNVCTLGRCLYTPIAGCKSCSGDYECEDNNACTTNSCINGSCSFTSMSGCTSCNSTSQCTGAGSCQTATCNGNKCAYTSITSCINNDGCCAAGCTSANDNDCPYICGNGIREGTEKCDSTELGGASCAGVLSAGYTGTLKCSSVCTFDTSSCIPPCTCSSDNNACTTDACVSGVCQHIPIASCCTTNAQCNDNNSCTSDSCSSGICTHTALTGTSCVNDNNACTSDICSSDGLCVHDPLTGTSCSSDNNACTTDLCSNDGTCGHNVINSCVNGDGCCPVGCTPLNDNDCIQCTTANQATSCNDNNVCTNDVCSSGTCTHTAIANCCTSVSQCTNIGYCQKATCANNLCSYIPITSCVSGDSCCPSGCNIGNDADCSAKCGDGIVNQAGEKCDGTNLGGASCASLLGLGYTGTLKCTGICTYNTTGCVAPCTCLSDGNACTVDICVNNVCQHNIISSCGSGDGCCPVGCNIGNDADCTAKCGDGLINQGSEKCDGTNLGGATCVGVLGAGYSGTLKCTSQCTFDTSGCIPPCTCSSDGNACTTDLCSSNVCQHISISGCCNINSDCGTGKVCTGNVCVASCTAETNTAFCSRLGKNCGTLTGLDNCGTSRTVTSCGTCTSPQTCGGSGTSNLCGGSLPPSNTGNVYYISPSGSDSSGNGSITKPWWSLTKAWTAVNAGDTIYMRGGTYKYTDTVNLEDKIGTYDKMINVFNFPGEKPIIDYNGVNFGSQTQCFGIFLRNDNYIHLKGIRVTNAAQVNELNAQPNYGMILWDSVDNSIFEQIETDHIGGWGTVIGDNSDNNLFLNCDSHHNADPYSTADPYGGSDGFETGSVTSTNNTFRGCRAWDNSDDGWDLRRANGVYTLENCWSFWNGYYPDKSTVTPGNGEGFKLGGKSPPASTSIIRTVKNCLAFENKAVGFSPEPDAPEDELGVQVYNSVSYKNALGINFEYNNVAILRNNIIYSNTIGAMYSWGPNVVHDHNNLDSSITVTNSDFLSVDSTGMDGPRNFDGSLPNINFLHLAQGSHLINAGVAISGITSDGYGNNIVGAPDIGAYETNYGAACTAETNVAFCSRLGKNCGTLTGLDNCGTSRTVTSCGTCTSPQTCGGSGTSNLCGSPSCTAETNTVFCSRLGKSCGSFTAVDNCGTSRTVTSCGTCSGSTPTCTNNICTGSSGNGKTYYLSPSGNDNTGNGSITKPWFTLTKAWTVILPGDTVYLRGGTYAYSTKQTLSGKNGQAGNMINIWAYPGETPVFTDATSFNEGSWPQALILFYGDYFYWKGLEISYVEQRPDGSGAGAMVVYDSDNNIFERFNVHHNANGFEIRASSTGNLVLNSDFHHNNDPYGQNADGTPYPYGNADGVAFDFTDVGVTNTLRGCRMWWNSDDGLDLYDGEGNVIVDNCWAWYNGFAPGNFDNGGDGNGFKLGDTQTSLPTTVLRTVTNSISVYNKAWGFQDNAAECNMKLYNNIAYQNGYMGYADWSGGFTFAESGIPYYIKNNIAYGNSGNNVELNVLTNVNHNSWDTSGISVGVNDFVNLDVSQLLSPRNADGSLPTNITFLHLAQGSDLIGKGISVGLSTDGAGKSWNNPPSMGAFEYP